jgi:hypothetical protein
VQSLGTRKCQELIGFYNFTGADCGGKLVGISKKTWADAYMKLDDNDMAVHCFKDLGEGVVPDALVGGELPAVIKPLEQFTFRVYRPNGAATLQSLRWELFQTKNLEGEMLPLTRSALFPHIKRANYIAMRDKAYQVNHPVLPPIEENG